MTNLSLITLLSVLILQFNFTPNLHASVTCKSVLETPTPGQFAQAWTKIKTPPADVPDDQVWKAFQETVSPLIATMSDESKDMQRVATAIQDSAFPESLTTADASDYDNLIKNLVLNIYEHVLKTDSTVSIIIKQPLPGRRAKKAKYTWGQLVTPSDDNSSTTKTKSPWEPSTSYKTDSSKTKTKSPWGPSAASSDSKKTKKPPSLDSTEGSKEAIAKFYKGTPKKEDPKDWKRLAKWNLGGKRGLSFRTFQSRSDSSFVTTIYNNDYEEIEVFEGLAEKPIKGKFAKMWGKYYSGRIVWTQGENEEEDSFDFLLGPETTDGYFGDQHEIQYEETLEQLFPDREIEISAAESYHIIYAAEGESIEELKNLVKTRLEAAGAIYK